MLDYGVVVPVDEGVGLDLVLCDTHLGVGVVLKLELVAVQMVGGDVEQHGDVGVEVIHVVELEAAQLYHVPGVRSLCHLQSQGVAYVASQPHVVARLFHDVVDERCGGGLAVASGDADHAGVGIPACKLYLAYHGNVASHHLLYHRGFLGYAGALYYLVGIEYLVFAMVSFFPFYPVAVEHGLVVVLDGRHVRHKDIEVLFLSQDSGAHTTLGGA